MGCRFDSNFCFHLGRLSPQIIFAPAPQATMGHYATLRYGPISVSVSLLFEQENVLLFYTKLA
jgi:hypothetical protein